MSSFSLVSLSSALRINIKIKVRNERSRKRVRENEHKLKCLLKKMHFFPVILNWQFILICPIFIFRCTIFLMQIGHNSFSAAGKSILAQIDWVKIDRMSNRKQLIAFGDCLSITFGLLQFESFSDFFLPFRFFPFLCQGTELSQFAIDLRKLLRKRTCLFF